MTAWCRGRGAATIRDRGRFAMTSPLMRAVGDRRSGRWALAMAFAFLLFAGMGPPIRAAEDDPYSVTVKVDASGDVIAKTRDTARLDGQRRALTMLADRLSGGNGAAKLPKLDDKAITDMVLSFEVANEGMWAVRYVGQAVGGDPGLPVRPDGGAVGRPQSVARGLGAAPVCERHGAICGAARRCRRHRGDRRRQGARGQRGGTRQDRPAE